MYTFADLLQVLAPNGRGSDGWELAPPDGSHTDPFGVPKAGTVSALFAAGRAFGFYAPPGDAGTDNTANTARLLAGNPFRQDDPLVARAVRDQEFKSPLTTAPQGRVPIFFVQGFTDPLFPATEALQVLNQVRKADPAYPIKVFLGDIGHDYTADRQDEWDLAHAQMSEFLDHYLRPDRTPDRPVFDVGATVTRCLNGDAPMRYVAAPTWGDLHPRHMTFTSTAPGTTSSATPGPAGAATDPISTATLPLPGSYKGCRIVRPSQTDPTVATYAFPVSEDLVLMGGPVVDLGFATTGPDTQLHVRMWDVAPDGSAQGLVTRGTYRSLDAPGNARHARFQLDPQGYRFPAGHQLKVEVTANDAPFFQASNVPPIVTVERLQVTMPLHVSPTADASVGQPRSGPVATSPASAADRPTAGASAQLPATGTSMTALAALATMGLALGIRRLSHMRH